MEPATYVVSGLLVALTSGIAVKTFGNKKLIDESKCGERRASCSALLVEKIDNLASKVEDLKDVVNELYHRDC